MELNLELAFEEPVDLSHSFEVSKEHLARPELVTLEPVQFEGRLQKADPGFVLIGRMSISGSVTCVRCLTEVPFSRTGAVSWTFAPAHRKPNEEEIELREGDLDVVWYDDLVLPFDPFIEEQLQLEIPMKPLCEEACRGLCPTCGADRNVAPCDCKEPVDDRWSALKSLIPSR